MLNVRLAVCHLYGKQLLTLLSLAVSLMASFCAVLFPLDVLHEILDVIESVSEGFLTYFCIPELLCFCCVEILKISPYIHLRLLFYQSSRIFYPIIF